MADEKLIVNEDLKDLKSSGYEIADGEPDIRGWKVINDSDVEIGKVDELLFDVRYSKVRYLVVDLDGKPLNLASRDVLVPIGLAELNQADKRVIIPDVTAGHLASLPEYKKGKVYFSTEREIRSVFVPEDDNAVERFAERLSDEDRRAFYEHDHFDDEKFYRKRRTAERDVDDLDEVDETDEPVVREKVTTARRNDLDEDDVDHDRDDDGVPDEVDPVVSKRKEAPKTTTQEGGFAPFQEGVIEIKEHKEVPVVSKEARVVEEITINKDVGESSETVKDSVRKMKVDVEDVKDRKLG